MLRIFKIKGDSLFPLFKSNQLVLAFKASFFTLKPKDIVVFYHPKHNLLIKQIQKKENGKYYLIGTTPDSIDSRNFGFIDEKDIRYKVLCRIWG